LGAVLGLIKYITGATVALALSGCGALSIGDAAKAIFNPDPEPELTIPNVNRAAIEEADLAAVLVISPEAKIATPAAAIQMRDNLLIYNASDNRGVTMHGGLIYATLGFGTNLQAVLTEQDDPLVNNTVASDWPEQVQRTYQLSGRGITFDEIVTTCTSRMGQSTQIDVVGVMRRVVEMVEICETAQGAAFNNIHYIDTGSGQVWRTSQWTGPIQQNVQVDVIEQFDPDS
jgi:hypothetical protein